MKNISSNKKTLKERFFIVIYNNGETSLAIGPIILKILRREA